MLHYASCICKFCNVGKKDQEIYVVEWTTRNKTSLVTVHIKININTHDYNNTSTTKLCIPRVEPWARQRRCGKKKRIKKTALETRDNYVKSKESKSISIASWKVTPKKHHLHEELEGQLRTQFWKLNWKESPEKFTNFPNDILPKKRNIWKVTPLYDFLDLCDTYLCISRTRASHVYWNAQLNVSFSLLDKWEQHIRRTQRPSITWYSIK